MFSYYLLPHLSLEEDKTPAAAAYVTSAITQNGWLTPGWSHGFDFDKLEEQS